MSIQPEVLPSNSKDGENATKLTNDNTIYIYIIIFIIIFSFVLKLIIKGLLIGLGLMFLWNLAKNKIK